MSRSLRRNGKCRRGEKGCLESVVYPAGDRGSNPSPPVSLCPGGEWEYGIPCRPGSAVTKRSSQTPALEGAAVPPGVPEAAAAAPQSAEAAAVPVVSAGCLAASVFRADLPLLNSL